LQQTLQGKQRGLAAHSFTIAGKPLALSFSGATFDSPGKPNSTHGFAFGTASRTGHTGDGQ
jgi:hypothetical protein